MNEPRRPQGALDPDQVARPDGDPRRVQGTPEAMRAAQPDSDSRSITEMISAVVGNLQSIVRSEVQLAKTELKEEAQTAGKAAGMLAAGAALGFYALGLFLMTLVWILATQMPNWVAALIVTVVVGAIAAVLALKGKSQLQEIHPMSETVDSVKEDVEWVKQQTQ